MDINDISQEEFERIEAYINGQLSGDALAAFENQLKKDESFVSKVETIKTVLTGIEAQSMKEQLNLFHDEISVEDNHNLNYEPKVKSLNWKRIAVAAALIIAAGSFWLLSGNTNEKLYAKYFSPDPGLPTTMSSNDNYDFYEAMVNYKQGNYKEAISKWETLQKTKPNNDTLQYFIGVAHLAEGNENKAIELLNTVTQFSNSNFTNEAYYYLGLAHLKANNLELAKQNLGDSSTENSKALLSELAD